MSLWCVCVCVCVLMTGVSVRKVGIPVLHVESVSAECSVCRVSVVNCGSRLCTVVAMRVGGRRATPCCRRTERFASPGLPTRYSLI